MVIPQSPTNESEAPPRHPLSEILSRFVAVDVIGHRALADRVAAAVVETAPFQELKELFFENTMRVEVVIDGAVYPHEHS